jgi:THO complex subunit 3
MDPRAASFFSGGHADDVDYVAWNPTHPELFCTSSQKDRRVVFWDARQSRSLQQLTLRSAPMQINYSPDGRTIVCVSVAHHVSFLALGKEGEESKETWRPLPKDSVHILTRHFQHIFRLMRFTDLACFNRRIHSCWRCSHYDTF